MRIALPVLWSRRSTSANELRLRKTAYKKGRQSRLGAACLFSDCRPSTKIVRPGASAHLHFLGLLRMGKIVPGALAHFSPPAVRQPPEFFCFLFISY
jgi:hypothetical protein